MVSKNCKIRLIRLFIVIFFSISLIGCKQDRPTSKEISLTYAGFSSTDIGIITQIRKQLEIAEVNFVSEKIKIDEISRYFWKKNSDKFKTNVRSQDSITYFVLAQSFYSQLLAIKDSSPYTLENSQKIKNNITVLYNSYKQMDALECYNECISDDESHWAIDTFFGGGAFALALIGVNLGFLALFGFFINRIATDNISKHTKSLNKLTNLDLRFRINILSVSNQNSQALTYYKAFELLYKINDFNLKSFLLLRLSKYSFIDATTKLKEAKSFIAKMKKSKIDLIGRSATDIEYLEHVLGVMSAYSYSSIAFYNSMILYFYKVKIPLFSDKKTKETLLEDSLVEFLYEVKSSLNMYDDLKKYVSDDDNFCDMQESKLRAEFILQQYYSTERNKNLKEDIDEMLFIHCHDDNWRKGTTETWLRLFGKKYVEPIWPKQLLD